jgi:hypothetical protein
MPFSNHPLAPQHVSPPHWLTTDGSELPQSRTLADADRPFEFQRMLRRLPANVLSTLTPLQLDAISDALIPDAPTHAVDYRASIPFMGRRFYITLLAGRERRSLARLAREAQLRAKHVAAFYSVALLVLGCLTVTGSIIIGYVAKSALDIDLMDGPSLLHGYFFPEQQSATTGQTPGI